MKKLIFISLMLSACGKEDATPTAQASPTPTAAPEVIKAACKGQDVVGNWIDSKSNTLALNEDCSATSIDQKLTWALSENNISFEVDKIKIDSCTYDVTSSGSLTSPISILLNLFCEKAGSLQYKKQ